MLDFFVKILIIHSMKDKVYDELTGLWYTPMTEEENEAWLDRWEWMLISERPVMDLGHGMGTFEEMLALYKETVLEYPNDSFHIWSQRTGDKILLGKLNQKEVIH